MTLKELCKKLDIAYQRIADQRTDCRFPKLEDAYALAKAVGVSLDYLLAGSDSSFAISKEAQAVEESPELQALVRAVMRDPQLLSALATVIESSERVNIG